MSGAAVLAGRAALRSGAGLVQVATPAQAQGIVAAQEPCFTTLPLPGDARGQIDRSGIGTVLEALADNDVAAVGPGLGQSPALRDLMLTLVRQSRIPLVLDADGLNNLSKVHRWFDHLQASLILTPHPGEMQRLWTRMTRQAPPPERGTWAQILARETRTVVVLKGAGTVVTNGRDTYINTTGNPGMATGGSGDVLTGIIAALLGQGLSPLDAAVTGVYVHGRAGDIAAQQTGQTSLIATDIIESLGAAFQ
jgi:NAD(P)H-hydrate epimerase